MKLARIAHAGAVSLAVVETDVVRPIPGDMLELIKAGPEGLKAARAAAASAPRIAAGEVRFLAPLPRPPKGVIGIGLNYAPHVEESARTMQTPKEMPTHPVLFIKPSTAIIGPGDPIRHDAGLTRQLDYEAELGVVIGTGAGRSLRPTGARTCSATR